MGIEVFLGQTLLALDHFILFVRGRHCPHSPREKPHLNDLRKQPVFVNRSESITLKESAESVFSFIEHNYKHNILGVALFQYFAVR